LRIKIGKLCYHINIKFGSFRKTPFEIKYFFILSARAVILSPLSGEKAMKQMERIGVSLDKELLSMFDKLIAKQGYQSRSEAIRDLIREQLSSDRLRNPRAKAVAAVLLVYDHHSTKVMGKLTGVQHSHVIQTISSVHIHLDEHDCLEVIVLRGRVGEINKMAEKIVSIKGVKLGRINLIATEEA